MTYYVDKDVIVAEINRLKDSCYKICAGNLDFLKNTYPEHYYSIETYDKILSFIDTLEVKEVDLNNEKCKDLNNDGYCIYAFNKTGKLMRCENINCSRKIKAQKGE